MCRGATQGLQGLAGPEFPQEKGGDTHPRQEEAGRAEQRPCGPEEGSSQQGLSRYKAFLETGSCPGTGGRSHPAHHLLGTLLLGLSGEGAQCGAQKAATGSTGNVFNHN